MVKQYWSIWIIIVLIGLSMTGCPPVASLDPVPVGDLDHGDDAIAGSACIFKQSPLIYPFTANIRHSGRPIISDYLGWGINYGLSGISPYLKTQVIQNPFQMNIRIGAGGSIIMVPIYLFGLIAHCHGDATITINLSENNDLYFGTKSFLLGAAIPTGEDTTGGEKGIDIIDEEQFIQGVWLGGYLGCRINRITFELGLHRVMYGTEGTKDGTFDNWSPSIGFSYKLKPKD